MFSDKQLEILTFPYCNYDALICDGAIRSGKTSIMTISFVRWAMESFNNQRFAICGKTVDSAIKNIVVPLLGVKYMTDNYSMRFSRATKTLEVYKGKVHNTIEIFGGKDEASFSLIQGRTLAGCLLDEVALMPKSFVDQALARCSVYKSRFWFSCNPNHPEHWFYQEWITQADKHNALYLHFELEDNPSLPKEIIDRYHSMYSGVFYDRYIRGLWVVAEGVIFPYLSEDISKYIVSKEDISNVSFNKKIIGIDFGGNGSATTFCLTGYVNGYERLLVLKDKMMNIEAEIGAKEICDTFIEFYKECVKEYGYIDLILGDAASPTMINSLRRAARENSFPQGNIGKCKKTELSDRPRTIDVLFKSNRLKIVDSCDNTIKALKNLRWDEKKPDIPEDKNISNVNDMYDAFCYSWTMYSDYIENFRGRAISEHEWENN